MKDIVLFFYTVAMVWAVLTLIPPVAGLGNMIKIIFFHIPTAWVAVLAFLWSAYYAWRVLKSKQLSHDTISSRAAGLGLIFCLLGTISGAVFAKLTWGAYWNWDPRQITIFVLLLIYGAYFALRSSIQVKEVRARISSVYSLLACVVMPFLVFVIPRFYFSLHPDPIINRSGTIHMDNIMIIVLLLALLDATCIFLRCLYWKGAKKI